MASVVQLSEYRKARKVRQAAKPAGDGAHYFCLRCDGDQFQLLAAGSVHCTGCGALMRNITVVDAENGRTGLK